MTRSPTRHRVTSPPISSIVPAYSRPGMSCGKPGGAGYCPRRCSRSARLIAVAFTRTRTCLELAEGAATSRSCSTSGSPGLVITIACMASTKEKKRQYRRGDDGEEHCDVEVEETAAQ